MKYITVSLLVLFVIGIIIPNASAETVPAWVKNTAGWWADGQIPDSAFIDGIEYLIKDGLIVVSDTEQSESQVNAIPTWVKNTAGWWADGQMDDSSFVLGLQWLITNGIIVIEEKIIHTDVDFRVAFLGDQGLNSNSIAVLNLIKDEGAQMVLHQGDLDYEDDPDAWDKMISNVLGDDFPYFVSIGSHDAVKWDEYQQKSYDRLKKIPDAKCIGDLGVKSSCSYKGLFFIQVGPALKGLDHSSFIENQLNNNDHIWRVCSWSKVMHDMQLGQKEDTVGWEVYENCKNGSAIIVTAHEHSYHRTKTLIDIENQIVDPEWTTPDKLRVKEGSTFVSVSGSGGHSIRDQDRCLPVSYPYGCNHEWANIYTTDQGATFGALFCTFNIDGQPNKAYCYFKNIDGKIIDAFIIISSLGIYSDNTNLIDVNMSDMDLTGNDFSNTVITNTNLSNTILVGADLSNVVLIGTTLTGADLTGANLAGITIIGNDLTNTILRGVNLTDASLVSVDLSGRDLTNTILRGVDLTDKDLTGTILRGADLSNSILTDVNLSDKDLTGTILRGVDLTDKDLTGTILRGADLTDANLAGQDISDHDLTDVILTGADLSNSLLPDNGLSEKNFQRTIFNMVDLSGKDLTKSIFECVTDFSYYYLKLVSANCINFVDTNLENTNLTNANFVNTDLTMIKNKSLAGADLSAASFAYSDLSGVNLYDVSLLQTNFAGTNLSGQDFTVVSNTQIYGVDFTYSNLSNANFEGMMIGFDDNVLKRVIENDSQLENLPFDIMKDNLFGTSRVLILSFEVFGNDLIIEYVFYNDFQYANLENTNFKNADLKVANFAHATLTNANLEGVDLRLTYFNNANLTNANLTNANLTNANLTNANLTNANLTNANLTNANLDGADLQNVILDNVVLSNARLGCVNHPICSGE